MGLNQELSKVFEQFAEILELKNEIRFKVVAYQRAAQVIGGLGEDIGEIYKSRGIKGLDQIDGVGSGIAHKIEEYIKTDKIAELEKLKKDFPRIEIDLMRVPGIGPKIARKLFEAFKPDSIEGLSTQLSRDGHKFFKEKTLKNLLEGIEIYKGFGNRMLINRAEDMAREIIGFLQSHNHGENFVPVGSLRRMKETIGDIDIVASSKEPQKLIDDFVSFKGFTEIINQRDKKASAVFEDGIRVDLEVLPEESFGTLLLHFTGSKQHNIELRSYALEKGLSISEHGIKDSKTDKMRKFSREEDVYKYLGLDYVPPELREGRGELKAAQKHRLPKLVEMSDIKGDLHIHSNHSDGSGSIEEIVEKAALLNYRYVAITDHAADLTAAKGLDAEGFRKRCVEIGKIKEKYQQINVLSSCEANIRKDGSLDISGELLKEFDIVTASIHSAFDMEKSEMTKRLIRAISGGEINIVGHPTGRILNRRESYDLDWGAVFKACLKHKVVLEINASPYRLDINDSIILEAIRRGVKMSISTDAHSVSAIENMKYGLGVARRGWCEKSDILNAMSISELRKYIARG